MRDAPFHHSEGCATAAAIMRLAEVRLHQAQDIDRLGYLFDSLTQDAADLLRGAGMHELADRLDDDPWGCDPAAILKEIDAECRR